jgi:hypothetical protein
VEAAAEPLGRLQVALAYSSKRGIVKGTKTGSSKMIPVHPTLAAMLVEWKVTLDARSLEDDALEVNPSFFWYRCNCDDGEHILVKHVDGGLEGVMTAMTDGPVPSPLPAASLLLEAFPLVDCLRRQNEGRAFGVPAAAWRDIPTPQVGSYLTSHEVTLRTRPVAWPCDGSQLITCRGTRDLFNEAETRAWSQM